MPPRRAPTKRIVASCGAASADAERSRRRMPSASTSTVKPASRATNFVSASAWPRLGSNCTCAVRGAAFGVASETASCVAAGAATGAVVRAGQYIAIAAPRPSAASVAIAFTCREEVEESVSSR